MRGTSHFSRSWVECIYACWLDLVQNSRVGHNQLCSNRSNYDSVRNAMVLSAKSSL